MKRLSLDASLRQYLIVTANYWAFTLTDGALRMLVLLYFHTLGYSPLELASLFFLYELFGVVTNLCGGWLAARIGLNTTMHIGLTLQVLALAMLLVDQSLLTVWYVMTVQALSGIAKDLNKLSAKSSIKLLIPDSQQHKLYRWVALLTGSKNTLKGLGFFLAGALLSVTSFNGAIAILASALAAVLLLSLTLVKVESVQRKRSAKFTDVFSTSTAVNVLSAARFFLFGARDVWFVIALPVYLTVQLQWPYVQVGAFLALWIIGYGLVQSFAPHITGRSTQSVPDGKKALIWALCLSVVPVSIVAALSSTIDASVCLVVGLLVFGFLFAVNSSLHSYLIVAYAKEQGVSLDVGFYYMANAAGRLAGTVLSGMLFQWYGLQACLLASTVAILLAAALAYYLPRHPSAKSSLAHAAGTEHIK